MNLQEEMKMREQKRERKGREKNRRDGSINCT